MLFRLKTTLDRVFKNKFGINNDVIGLWQSRWNEFLSKVDLILTPSKSTKEIVENIYDNIDCRAIEHGINITKQAKSIYLWMIK